MVRLPLISQGLVNLQYWPSDTVTSPWILPLISPLLQLCPGCPPSWLGSASDSTRGGQTGGFEPGTGVHGKGSVPCARSTFDLTICGATVGSGRHELAISG